MRSWLLGRCTASGRTCCSGGGLQGGSLKVHRLAFWADLARRHLQSKSAVRHAPLLHEMLRTKQLPCRDCFLQLRFLCRQATAACELSAEASITARRSRSVGAGLLHVLAALVSVCWNTCMKAAKQHRRRCNPLASEGCCRVLSCSRGQRVGKKFGNRFNRFGYWLFMKTG